LQGKIVIEEHFAIPETAGIKNRVVNPYWEGLANNLVEFHSKRLGEMDKFGIELAIVSLNAPAVQGINDPREALDVARRANDALAEEVRKRPDRFQGFAALPLQDPDAAAKELRRCVKELGFHGALVNGWSNSSDGKKPLYYDAAMYNGFWAEAAALGKPFYLHPRDPFSLDRYEGHAWLVGSAWSFAEETALHALRLMGSGLFDRHPKLQLILGHLGERIPYDIWRLDHRLQFRHDYPAKQKMGYYLRNNVHVTTSGHFRTQTLLNAMLEMGADRVMFAVDYPYEQHEPGATWFDACEISEADRRKIGRENAIRLFGLNMR
jgi:2,3-dihydroxybenzoate decarboxylase